VKLSRAGEIAVREWTKTEVIRPNVELDEWIFMPNHMHAILAITEKIDSRPPAETPRHPEPTSFQPVETPRRGVSARGWNTRRASDKWAPNILGSIVGQFKGKCTKRIRGEGYADFAWQARYYDRIIRSNETLDAIRAYIILNPRNWENDIYHSELGNSWGLRA